MAGTTRSFQGAIADKVPQFRLSYGVVSMTGDLLLLADLLCICLTAYLTTLLYGVWVTPHSLAPDYLQQAALIAAVIAPFILYDRRFGSAATRGQIHVLLRSHVQRFAIFTGLLWALGVLSQTLDDFPRGSVPIWWATALLATSFMRVLGILYLRRLQRRGVLSEVIAVVGAGPVADRLVHALRQARPETIELLGVFDDKIIGAKPSTIKRSGTLAQLIELGKSRKIDWIVLALPATAEHRVWSIVQRLKALSAPIGLCPQPEGLAAPSRSINYVGDTIPVSLLAGPTPTRWNTVVSAAEEFVPRWIITLVMFPLAMIAARSDKLVKFLSGDSSQHRSQLTLQFDNYDVANFSGVAAGFGQDQYGYAVTPNADHIIRLHENASFRALYAEANYILLDSRFISHVLRIFKGMQLPVCTGSDITARLFSNVISPDDSLVLIGGTEEQAGKLRARYGLRRLAQFIPPMGFIRSPKAVDECLQFIEAHSPFRFCFLAIGAPQQEIIAQHLKDRGTARGLALCIGASINFLTGDERRAPFWIQRVGMEWFFRLIQAPGRMAQRYLVRGPRIFGLLQSSEIMLRKAPAPILRSAPQFHRKLLNLPFSVLK